MPAKVKKLFFLILLALLGEANFNLLTAQTPAICPSSDTPAADFCPEACVSCNLETYTGNTSGYTQGSAPGFCGTIENEQWLGFVAAVPNATISVVPSNCYDLNGVQVALYANCGLTPIACNQGAVGGGFTPVSITADLTPGAVYYLMVDGYAGDQCDFTLTISPPGAAQGLVIAQNILLCPGQTYAINGVEYTAPNVINMTIPSGGICDTIVVYNLIEKFTETIGIDVPLCSNETFHIGGVDYAAPDTITVTIPGDSGCDSILTYNLLLKTYNEVAQEVAFCSGESVTIEGVTYSEPGVVRDTIPGTTACDTIITYNLQFNSDEAACPTCAETFMKIVGEKGQNVRGYGVYNALDGNLYVTGLKQDSALIMKINPAGGVIWTRSFDFVSGVNDNIAEIITDSEGMIAGCGQSGDEQPNVVGFVFRYNPVNHTMLWTRTFDDESPHVTGILEKSPGGNYLIYYNPHLPVNDGTLAEISRTDGGFLPALLSKKLGLGIADNFNSVQIFNGNLYAVGRFTNGTSTTNMRHSLTRIDPLNGDITYTTLAHVSSASPARLYGMDMLIEDNHVISVSFGDENGENLNNNLLFLYKTTLTGSLVWAKRINVQAITGEMVDEVVSVPDGYILYARNFSGTPGDLYLIKTDKSGNYVWSKKVDYGFNDNFLRVAVAQSQILVKDDRLYFTATTTDAAGNSQMMLLKTTLDATLEGDCNFISSTPVTISSVANPSNVPVLITDTPATGVFNPISTASTLTALASVNVCNVFVNEQVEVTLCPGESIVINGVTYSDSATVIDTILNANGCDTLLTYSIQTAPQIEIDSTVQFCPGESINIGGNVYNEPGIVMLVFPDFGGGCDTFATYYLELLPQPSYVTTLLLPPGESTLINGNTYFAPDTVQTTLPAATGCDTLATFILLLDPVIADTCEATASFYKTIGEQGAAETGNVICASADGNFYIAGEKGEECLLLKVAPSGEVLWSRTFMPDPLLATHITDLIEDTDGMLTGCGIVGAAGSSTKSHVFRYNPLTGNLLWSKILQQQNPKASAVLEKNPGGNFLLLINPQLTLNVGDAEIWELNRNTGALVGSLTHRYNYGISDVFTSMVIHDGAIYTLGRHIPNFTTPPPVDKMRVGLSRIDLATGAPAWSRLSHVDPTASATLFGDDLLIHDDAVLAVYSGTDSIATGQDQAFFLQKTGLDGNLLWVKRYHIPGAESVRAADILLANDGYVLAGAAAFQPGQWEKIVAKADFDGNILWAKRLPASNVSNAASSYSNNSQHQCVAVNDVLYLTGATSNTLSDALFVKMTPEGQAGDSCAFAEPLIVEAKTVPDPVNVPIQLVYTQAIGQSVNAPAPVASIDLSVATYCVSCLLDCDDTLDLGPDIILCKDSTLVFNAGGNFASYLWQDGSTDSTYTASVPDVYWVEVTNDCGDKQRDSVLLTVSLVGDIKLPDSTLCIGESLTLTVLGFDIYDWSPSTGLSCDTCSTITIQPNTTTVYSLFAENEAGCSTSDTFTVTVLPLPTRAETLAFCPGESVTIGGNTYTQPGTVIDTLPGIVGCDTVVTYTLQYIDSPNSAVSIDCPDGISIATSPGTGPVAVSYNLPTVSSDCECPGIALTLTQGPVSGGLFPPGTTQVCYAAKDSCGNTATCCFEVMVREEQPCDVKTLGCLKWELLTITKGANNNLTYRIRVTNTCANKLIYTAFQVPNGVKAVSPADYSVFTAASGRKYEVRNPNFSPFYSIRFKSIGNGIANGQSDVLEYVLPGNAPPAYIHVVARVNPKEFYEAHLNTFYCPVGVTPPHQGNQSANAPAPRADDPTVENLESLTLNHLTVFPNPTDGVLFADLSDWHGEQLQVQVFDSRGQRVQHATLIANDAPQEVPLPKGLASGLYSIEVVSETGEKRAARFVVQR